MRIEIENHSVNLCDFARLCETNVRFVDFEVNAYYIMRGFLVIARNGNKICKILSKLKFKRF